MNKANLTAITHLSSKTAEERLHADFSERVRSLLADGYCLRVRSERSGLLFARLHHMCNGNDIKIYGNYNPFVLRQFRNNILVHIQVYE